WPLPRRKGWRRGWLRWARAVLTLRGDLPSGRSLQQAVDDHPLLALETIVDRPQAVHRGAGRDAPPLHDVLLVHDEHIGALLVVTDRRVANEERRPLLERHAHPRV